MRLYIKNYIVKYLLFTGCQPLTLGFRRINMRNLNAFMWSLDRQNEKPITSYLKLFKIDIIIKAIVKRRTFYFGYLSFALIQN